MTVALIGNFFTIYDNICNNTTDWKDESRSALLRAAHEAKQQAAATAATATAATATADTAATEVTDSTCSGATVTVNHCLVLQYSYCCCICNC
jgi:hypothetical protein